MLSALGNKVFRHVGLPPEHDFQCGCPLLQRCGCFSFCIRHGIELRWICSASHRSRRQRRFSPTFLIAYSAKGARWRKSTEDTRVYPGMYLMPKSAMKLSLVVFGWFLAMPQRRVVSMFFMSRRG